MYNNILIPYAIPVKHILSAFDNVIDYDKVEEYSILMCEGEDFPSITGYPDILDKDDVGKEFLTGSEVSMNDVGTLVWYVTDGHHRALASILAEAVRIDVSMDISCFTIEKELLAYQEFLRV